MTRDELAMSLPDRYLPTIPKDPTNEQIREICKEFGIPLPGVLDSKTILKIGYRVHAVSRYIFADEMLAQRDKR